MRIPGKAKEMVEFIKQKFMIRQCRKFKSNQRECLNYHIKRCMAPCTKRISKEEYHQIIAEIMDLLSGKTEKLIKTLKEQISTASQDQNFEKAAYLRDKMIAIENISEKQKVSNISENDIDVIGYVKNELRGCIEIFFVRNSKMVGREHYFFENIKDIKDEEVILGFLKQFYIDRAEIPNKIMIQEEIEDIDVLSGALSKIANRKVEIKVPKVGEKLKFVEMAKNNAKITLDNKTEDKYEVLNELQTLLNLEKLPRKIECFDVSNIAGTNTVCGMCVMEDGRINKKLSKRFKIKEIEGQDDPRSMEEAIRRRLVHSIEKPKGSFGRLPDLILVDGGITQIKAAKRALKENQVAIPIYGMIKDNKHRTKNIIDENRREYNMSEQLKNVITNLQDTVHDTAITYHKKLRDKEMTLSALDEIKGIGKQKKEQLIKTFGSVENIKKATIEELIKVKGINEPLAKTIKQQL